MSAIANAPGPAAHLVALPLLVALATAVLTLVGRRWPRFQTAASVGGSVAYAAAVGLLVEAVLAGGPLTYQVGDWRAPYGISLVADALSAFMLALAAAVTVPALVAAVRQVDAFGQRVSFHPLFHFMLVGVTGAFLTGDIFNLFVWFEVMLMASYVLVVFYGEARHTRAAFQYLVLNLLGSAVMLLAIGGLYATTGTLNMADMARRLAAAPESIAVAPVLGLSALLFAVFALKAGLAPFQFWVPAAYRAAPAPVAAMLAGVVKKVGVYAIVRLYFTVFAAADYGSLALPGVSGSGPLAYYGPVLFAVATASILVGGLGAVDRDTLEGLLSYSSISQVGFIVLPLAVGAAAAPGSTVRLVAVAAALVYSLNHALAKALLFLAAGVLRDATGTSRFAELGGVAGHSPVLSACVFVGLLALVGIPPLAGFFGKFLVFDAAVRGSAWVALGVALVGALFTIAYTSRAWNRGFWGDRSPAVEVATVDRVQVAAVAVLAAAVVGVGVGFDPVLGFATEAAGAALDRGAYVSAVFDQGGGAA